ncbi:hypothetical protein VNO78_28757 [Psophocarpus tetragonolobus]|uniref:TF-B3 domain-containing protein n=1 Tax=Psophocarpus tetragonolobus TaxID=3891 RepID=A0AAN9RTQ7_PSOTE
MVGENCNGCRSWEEDIYWSHFQFLHFLQFLRADFNQHLALPKSFSDNLKKKLPENVTLKGPSGVAWNIGITTRDDTLYFEHGWEQFVKDHCLKENDLLVFKYNGESQIDVLVFDGRSLCEKAGSYFVRKCGHTETEQGGGSLNKKRDTADSLEEANTPSNAGVEFASPDKSVHVNCTKEPMDVPIKTPSFNTEFVSVSPDQFIPNGLTPAAVTSETAKGKRIQKLVSAVKHVQTKRRGRPTKESIRQKAIDWVTGLEGAASVSVVKKGSYEEYKSNRRPVTQDEIENAKMLAQANCTGDSVCIEMKPSHVYKRFFVSNKWISDHLTPRSQDVILRMDKGEWTARYSYHSGRGSGGLTGGWKHFALDNNLELNDQCVFKPAGKINNTLVLEITIFRVVQEIVPLTALSPPGTRKRGRKSSRKAIERVT